MTLPPCSLCGGGRAEIKQPHTGLRLCWRCFRRQVVERVRNEVKRWGLFEPGHRLLLAVSGGKDSFTLLDVLSQIHDTGRMVALTIIEGIPGGYHVEEARAISRYARSYGVDHVVVSFRDYFGATLAEMVREASRRGVGEKPCTFCGVLRRRIMEEQARLLGADRVVTAHNLDDEAQTALMNLLRGDYVGLVRMHPVAALATRDFVPRVKPLRKVYEWETAAYAFRSGYPIQSVECPYLYEAPTLRLRARLAMYRLEGSRPGSLLRMMEALDVLLEPAARSLARSPVELPRCARCGAPTSPTRRLCKACELLEKVGLRRAPQQTLQPG